MDLIHAAISKRKHSPYLELLSSSNSEPQIPKVSSLKKAFPMGTVAMDDCKWLLVVF